MSTKLHDLPTNGRLGVSLTPDTYTESQTGRSIDLIAGDGTGFFLAPTVAVTTPEPIEFQVEESSDESTWTEVSLTPPLTVTAPFDGVAMGRFVRTKRYVRARMIAEEDSEVRTTVIIGQQLKTV